MMQMIMKSLLCFYMLNNKFRDSKDVASITLRYIFIQKKTSPIVRHNILKGHRSYTSKHLSEPLFMHNNSHNPYF